jgi:hypothetical protein
LKLKICDEVSRGIYSQEEARRFYNIQGKSNISRWMRKFGYQLPDGRLLIMSKDKQSPEDPEVLKARIAALEQQLKDAELRALCLDTMIDVAEETLNIQVRKKSSTNRSKDSE